MTPPSEPPRLELASLPTPVDHLEALSRELGIEVWVKRDDLTGALLSGSKIRKLEYILPAVLDACADVVITCGAAQSNHCRTTSACARRLGLDVELFLHELPADGAPTGNLLLSRLMAPVVHPLEDGDPDVREARMAARADELEAQGRRAFVIPAGASSPLGCVGYVRCMREILVQQEDLGLEFDLVVVAAGTGGTLAGLLAGARRHGFRGRLLGVPVEDPDVVAGRVTGLLEGLRRDRFPDLATDLPGDLLHREEPVPTGPPNPAELARIRDVAVLSGLVLDPVYTNRAFGVLLSLIRKRAVPEGSRVLFLHTGGLFGLFPHAADLDALSRG